MRPAIAFVLFSVFVLKAITTSLHPREVSKEMEESALTKRFYTSTTCPPGAHCIHRRFVGEKVGVPTLVKRGHSVLAENPYGGWSKKWLPCPEGKNCVSRRDVAQEQQAST
ncbi:uncharacterized protein FA14DRAFT_156798 [Meira miltonrushii]|uniref:Secreted protein n=1 Tax=Meira miltonrushii TaxID=1280837 RepID=A0A316VA32_9BASI|nr:uncharacterized protein FA14DRAFT_156798 [Meira miltonrushii]PWN34134.1 hypothetical protein FA14DRAFT_156798 [Meira miltonrushii]